MKRIHSLLIILISAVGTTWAQAPYLDMVGRADSLAREGSYRDAVNVLDSALSFVPDDAARAMVLSNKAVFLLWDGDNWNALDILDEAHRLAPNSATILNNRAHVNMRIGRDVSAFEDFSATLAIDPDHDDARFGRVMLGLEVGQLDSAMMDVDYLLQKYPDDYRIHVLRGLVCNDFERYSDVIDEFTIVLASDLEEMEMGEYYATRASAYISLDRLPEASADIAEGLRLDSENPELYLQRARLLRKSYRYADAKADVKRARKLGANEERIRALGLE